jgi:murein DD-endopeptidase MepM/ murein hydrolase activator NlpD
LNRRLLWISSCVLILAVAGFGSFVWFRHDAARRAAEQSAPLEAAKLAAKRAAENQDQQIQVQVKKGETFSGILAGMNFDSATVYNVTQAAKLVFSLRTIKPGSRLLVVRSSQGQLRSLDYHIDPEHDLLVTKAGDNFQADIKNTPATLKIVPVSGTVQGSLFDGIMAAGESPELAVKLAAIFAWDIDFNSDTQPGDTFRLVVEKKIYADGSAPSYGRILAAEYVNAGHAYQAVLFHDKQGRPAYYSASGQSLQKYFLRSPLRFAARITSHFSYHRYHPILKIYRPHLGTDYAAPIGTPVQAIAGGRVVYAGRKGEDGNLVKLAHARGYETYYMHLSRILVRRGQMVHQGQTIGLVGQTGLATGPHLDFRLQQNGRFVNFERLQLPPAQPVAKADRAEFMTVRDRDMALMPGFAGTKVAAAGMPAAPDDANHTTAGGQP